MCRSEVAGSWEQVLSCETSFTVTGNRTVLSCEARGWVQALYCETGSSCLVL